MGNKSNEIFLHSSQMTSVVTPAPGTGQTSVPSSEASSQVPSTITPEAPSFQVPSNPLLPPGYQETLDYSSLQYVNGFYRTQIGRYVRIDQLIGSNNMTQQEGFLIGVGYNYLLLQEGYTGNIMVIDIYSVKNMYVYYNDRIQAFEHSISPSSDTETDI